MPLDDGDFASIGRMIELEVGRLIGRRADYFLISKVIKRDTKNMLVWVKELGDVPIPLLAFNYDVYVHDETPRGTNTTTVGTPASYRTFKKAAQVQLQCPKKGQTVLIAREMGSDFLPRCLGVLHSKNFLNELEGEY